MTAERRWVAYAALVVAVAGITWSAILVRWAGIPGPSSAFYRVFLAALVLWPTRMIRGYTRPGSVRPLTLANRRAWLLAIAGGAFFGLDLALYNTAVLKTTAAAATLLGNNAPIFVGIGTWLFFKRPPRPGFWVGLVLALFGAATIIAVSAMRGGKEAGNLTGDLLAVVAAVFFAGYMLTTERVRTELDTLSFNSIAAIGSVATLIAVCLVVGAPLTGFGARTWWALAGLAFVSQLGAYYALVYALGHLPATLTSVGLLAQVPLTALLAVPLLGETLIWPQAIGGVLVLAGIFVVNRGSS